MQIWKFKLELADSQVIEMPKGAKILTLQVKKDPQDEDDAPPKPHVWVEVDPNEPPVQRQFFTFGTGREIPDNLRELIQPVGTYQQDHFVWHVYEPKVHD